MSEPVRVDGGPAEFQVTVGRGKTATAHRVRVDPAYARRLAADADPSRLVEESFRFLLERESKESILPSFDLPVIARYFPEYEREIVRRLGDS